MLLLCLGCAQGVPTNIDGGGRRDGAIPGDVPVADSINLPDAGPASCVPLNAGTWRELGRPSVASAPHADTVVAPDGTLARISLAGTPPSPLVEVFDAGTWRALGVFPETNANANVVGLSHDGVSFVAMWARTNAGTDRPVVYRLVAGMWTEQIVLGGGAPASTSVAGSASLWASGGVVRVAGLQQLGGFETRQVVVAEHRGTSMALPNPPSENMGAFTPSLAHRGASLVLAWSEGSDLRLARYDSAWTSWTTAGLFMGLPSNPRAASSDAALWVAGTDFIDASTNVVRLFRVEEDTLVPATGPFDREPATGPAFVADMEVDSMGRAVLAMEEPAAPGLPARHVHVVRMEDLTGAPLGPAIDAIPGTNGTASLVIDGCDWPVLSVVERLEPGSSEYEVRTYRFED
ncbi:MAG: hypothetical protein AB8H86_06300 [Polyangiales bacterium]